MALIAALAPLQLPGSCPDSLLPGFFPWSAALPKWMLPPARICEQPLPAVTRQCPRGDIRHRDTSRSFPEGLRASPFPPCWKGGCLSNAWGDAEILDVPQSLSPVRSLPLEFSHPRGTAPGGANSSLELLRAGERIPGELVPLPLAQSGNNSHWESLVLLPPGSGGPPGGPVALETP